MNFLYCFLVATLVFASDSGAQTSRRRLWWANEARFIMGPPGSNDMKGPRKALANPSPHNYGSQIVLANRKTSDRYQKFRLQDTTEGVYIRFDNHPQPGIRTRDGDDKLELYNAGWDSRGEWMIMVHRIRVNNRWVEPKDPIDWTAEEVSKIGRMRIVVWNKGKDAYLRVKNGQPEMLKIDIEADKDKLMDKNWLREQGLEWELEYVNNQWTASSVAMMVLAPVAVVAAIGAVFAAPAIGAALFASYGLAAVPVMQVLGSAAASGATMVAGAIVSGLVNELFFEDTEMGLGDMDSSENGMNSMMNEYGMKAMMNGMGGMNSMAYQNGMGGIPKSNGYSIANDEKWVMQYGIYGLALVGFMVSAFGLYKLTCGRAKNYVEFQEIEEEEA